MDSSKCVNYGTLFNFCLHCFTTGELLMITTTSEIDVNHFSWNLLHYTASGKSHFAHRILTSFKNSLVT